MVVFRVKHVFLYQITTAAKPNITILKLSGAQTIFGCYANHSLLASTLVPTLSISP